MGDILLATAVLAGLAGCLAGLLLIAERIFADYGECSIDINSGSRAYTVQGGQSLLSALTEEKLFLPSACGGRGSCGFCRCEVMKGGGPVLPTETPYLSEEDIGANIRLACQIKVKEDLQIAVPEELLSVREFRSTVASITDLTHDIKGIRFRLPEGEEMSFCAGQYVQLVAPPYEEVRDETCRAYSIASVPSEKNAIELMIRLVPEGIVTTYVFEHMKESDTARLVGPFGDFFLRESDREIIFIAGGSGLAPIQSIVLDMIERGIDHRRASFFFGAVGTRDLYRVEEFKAIARDHEWFQFVPALSGEGEEHAYQKGLITEVVDRHYQVLDNHEAYLCGSPGMIDACVRVLTGKGLPEERIFYDKFS